MRFSLSHRTKRKILIVNGYSDGWKYIPMGTFGLCDFLSQRGVESKIFNAAIYNINEYLAKLKHVIDDYKPDYIGLIIHWKELLENCIFLSYEIKKLFPSIKIVAGGITAGFLDEELLRRFESIDFVIKGDPEKPLYMLMTKHVVTNIPNLAYRQNSGIIKNNSRYAIDRKTLNSISYTKLDYLIDSKEYIKQIDNALGFPIFIGRGCVYDCLFCGGSKKAFRTHSNRQSFICRDILYIIRDLERLRRYTDNIYIGYEVDLEYIYNLFTAILSEKKISGKFRLNYGAWHLMDYRLIDLYSRAFRFDIKKRSIIEISPETTLDKDRRVIRDKSLYFSNKQMLQTVKLIQQKFSNAITINIFYSRYHKTQNNKKKLMLELENIHKFREYIYAREENVIAINYGQLATDVGSFYWDSAFMNCKRHNRVDLLLSIIKRAQLSYSADFKMDNLCIYSLKQLSGDVKSKYEMLIVFINLMLSEVPSYYFSITRAIGFSKFIALLEVVVNKYFLFKNINVAYLIDALHSETKRKYRDFYDKNPIFFQELAALYIKYLNTKFIAVDEKQRCFIEKPLLDQNKFYVSNYNFIDKRLYISINKDLDSIIRKKTLNVFCSNRIYSFEYRYYHLFKLFNGKNTANDVLKRIAKYNFTSKDEFVKLYSFVSSYKYWFTI